MATIAELIAARENNRINNETIIDCVDEARYQMSDEARNVRTRLGKLRSESRVLMTKRNHIIQEILVVSQTIRPEEGRTYLRSKPGQKPRLDILQRESKDLSRRITLVRLEIQDLEKELSRDR